MTLKSSRLVFIRYQNNAAIYSDLSSMNLLCTVAKMNPNGLYFREKTGQDNFVALLRQTIEEFRTGLDFSLPLAYQDFTSLKFAELTAVL